MPIPFVSEVVMSGEVVFSSASRDMVRCFLLGYWLLDWARGRRLAEGTMVEGQNPLEEIS